MRSKLLNWGAKADHRLTILMIPPSLARDRHRLPPAR
jgi:hypothetical protein